MTEAVPDNDRAEDMSVCVDQELLTRAKGAVMLDEGREVTDDAVIGKALQALVVVWEKYQETADDEDGETPDDRHDPESENDQTEEENQETPKTDEKTVQEQNRQGLDWSY
jgi:hypothetical protein